MRFYVFSLYNYKKLESVYGPFLDKKEVKLRGFYPIMRDYVFKEYIVERMLKDDENSDRNKALSSFMKKVRARKIPDSETLQLIHYYKSLVRQKVSLNSSVDSTIPPKNTEKDIRKFLEEQNATFLIPDQGQNIQISSIIDINVEKEAVCFAAFLSWAHHLFNHFRNHCLEAMKIFKELKNQDNSQKTGFFNETNSLECEIQQQNGENIPEEQSSPTNERLKIDSGRFSDLLSKCSLDFSIPLSQGNNPLIGFSDSNLSLLVNFFLESTTLSELKKSHQELFFRLSSAVNSVFLQIESNLRSSQEKIEKLNVLKDMKIYQNGQVKEQ